MIQGKPLRSPVDLQAPAEAKIPSCHIFLCQWSHLLYKNLPELNLLLRKRDPPYLDSFEKFRSKMASRFSSLSAFCLSEPHPNRSDFFAGIFGTS